MIDHVAEMLRRRPAPRPQRPPRPSRSRGPQRPNDPKANPVARRDRRRTARLAAAWTGGTLSAAILAASGYGWSVTNAVDTATVRADVFGALTGRPADSPATDILIVGSDTRRGLSQDARDTLHVGSRAAADGQRSDTMILAQLAADKKSLTLLSIPRDSYITIPATADRPEHKAKINSALDRGGPALAVATVEGATGIRIDHFVQVDFSAFSSIVDAVGGVDVCLSKAVDDPLSGLKLAAGVSHVDGVRALAYVRARYTLTGGSDLGRIHRQQEFLGSLVQRVASSDVLADPGRFSYVIRAAASSVRTDSALSTEEMLKLALAAKNLPRDRIRFVSMPLADVDYQAPGIGSTVLWDSPMSARLFEAMRKDAPVQGVIAAMTAESTAKSDSPPPSAEPAPSASPPPPPKKHGKARTHVAQPTPLAVHAADQSICD